LHSHTGTRPSDLIEVKASGPGKGDIACAGNELRSEEGA
jgi:hypothetical protein